MDPLIILSSNVGSSTTLVSAVDKIKFEKPDLVFLQEVTLTTAELDLKFKHMGYSSEANVCSANKSKPGTACLWKSDLPVKNVFPIVERRAQSLKVGDLHFLNIYAPSGSNEKNARRLFPEFAFSKMQGLIVSLINFSSWRRRRGGHCADRPFCHSDGARDREERITWSCATKRPVSGLLRAALQPSS